MVCAVRGTDTAYGRNGLRVDWNMVILDDAIYEEFRSKVERVERVEELDASCLMHIRLLSLPSCWTSAGVGPLRYSAMCRDTLESTILPTILQV